MTARDLKRNATKLHSEYVRARDKRCMKCGRAWPLEAMHVVSRRYMMTRCDEFNAYAGCPTCHGFLTAHPDEHWAFFRSLLGDAHVDGLIVKSQTWNELGSEEFWRGEITRLKGLLGQLRAA